MPTRTAESAWRTDPRWAAEPCSTDAGHARGDEQDTGRGAQQRERTTTTADLDPAGPPRVVRLAPDQGDARADENGRPR